MSISASTRVMRFKELISATVWPTFLAWPGWSGVIEITPCAHWPPNVRSKWTSWTLASPRSCTRIFWVRAAFAVLCRTVLSLGGIWLVMP